MPLRIVCTFFFLWSAHYWFLLCNYFFRWFCCCCCCFCFQPLIYLERWFFEVEEHSSPPISHFHVFCVWFYFFVENSRWMVCWQCGSNDYAIWVGILATFYTSMSVWDISLVFSLCLHKMLCEMLLQWDRGQFFKNWTICKAFSA